MSRTLAEWLAYQERVNVHSIELGLDRVREVWRRMSAPAPAKRVITVGGTNGKGSTVALLEAMLRAADLRVGAFTSPHLLEYNERVRIGGVDADDAALIASFERIEASRGSMPLTYFEFGALAALDLFARAALDVAVLEVGLGGRLDAVNIIDADVAVITTVDLDHMEWLGPDRDSIGHEKAGIARAGRPAIVGELDPPAGLLDALAERGARVERAGIDFSIERHQDGWRWRHRDGSAMELPDPALAAPVQYANAAAAIAALHALDLEAFTPSSFFAAVSAGLHEVRVPARLQSIGGEPPVIVDVGHNPQAARALAEWLDLQAPTRVHAVYGALADKDVAGVIGALGPHIGHWHLAGLDQATPRGMPVAALAAVLRQVLPQAPYDAHADVTAALAAARAVAQPNERILAFGSFFVASAVLAERIG
ncbi:MULTISPECIES: bifunctional tetrahydrofolate synthase/dihydrofolate synthase [Rhodanobacter]|uniref:bifunctional tetrahydrofolate synthase/dihydrofolate synthase n=2 Tax=Rhodanobacteraceae TaxID=1775411 RepID=UPI00091D056C|nr:bifunctional tetrahydrofolate synthase/dihydrofolate synthase [Rhodanobacter thiooxydans]TAN18985.1 MAG: bifunctional tetrahydrofolate synthase/dihydrofolate synthase [Rhodanobacter sp.]UJJ56429.1 bifunctional tetrahydrofolate synthase/dihydrofolate synthase [Rhodanobacter thiooxydans]